MFTNRWQSWADMQAEMSRLRQEMDRLFGRYTDGGQRASAGGYPALNLWEDDDRLYVEAELPGLELGDLEIYVNGGNQLTIKGVRKQPGGENGVWHRQERGHGAFSRTVELPQFVVAERVEAEFKLGVLTVRLPKREEAKPRRIEVKSS